MGFHARYHARWKTYRYRIYRGPGCPPFLWRYVYHYPYDLDPRAMAEAAGLLLGEHDFASFAASGEESPDPDGEAWGRRGEKVGMVRKITRSRIIRQRRVPLLVYEVRGNGFLRQNLVMKLLPKPGLGKPLK